MKQVSNFLGRSFSSRDNVIVQSSLEEKGNSIILNDYFSSRTDPFIFTSVAPKLLESQQSLFSFSSIEINNSLPVPVNVSQIRFEFTSQLQLFLPIRCLNNFRLESNITCIESNVRNDVIKKVINAEQQQKCFFFYLSFLPQTFTIHRIAEKVKGYLQPCLVACTSNPATLEAEF